MKAEMLTHNEALIFFSEIGNLIKSFQLKDVFDILIIAALTYVFVVLFTKMFFNSFFGMFLVILVVVFQKELRRLFEFIGFMETEDQSKQKQ